MSHRNQQKNVPQRLMSTVHGGQRPYGLLGDISVNPGVSLAGEADAQCCKLKFYINKTVRSCVSWCHPFHFVNSSGLVTDIVNLNIFTELQKILAQSASSPILKMDLLLFIVRHFQSIPAVVMRPSCK